MPIGRRLLFSIMKKLVTSYRGRRLLEDHSRYYARRGRITLTSLPFSIADSKMASGKEKKSLPKNIKLPSAGAPLFITGRFRSGSTLLWSLFDQASRSPAFYEPFNEARWFNPSHRDQKHPHPQDSTHIGAGSYSHNYAGMEDLNDLFKSSWTSDHLYMDGADANLDMVRYIDRLVQAGTEPSVLQFNRMDFRLAFLRAYWPEASILHIYRDVRQSWASMLGRGVPVSPVSSLKDFTPYDRFYLIPWQRDLARCFPVFDFLDKEHPYLTHYIIWRLSKIFGQHYASFSLRYEDMITEPSPVITSLETVSGIKICSEIAKKLIIRPPVYSFTKSDDLLFSDLEELADRLLLAAENPL